VLELDDGVAAARARLAVGPAAAPRAQVAHPACCASFRPSSSEPAEPRPS
jgi:hypothetical protein